MCRNLRQLWTMTAICLSCALVIAAANPVMAKPYNKQPIYDGFDLFANTLSGYPTFQFSNNGDIVYQTRAWSTTLGRWAYSLHLYRQGGGTSLIPSGTEIKFDLQINDLGQVVWSETDSNRPSQPGLPLPQRRYYPDFQPKLRQRSTQAQ